MDTYGTVTSWALFGGVVAFGCWYYYPSSARRPQRMVEEAGRRKRTEQEDRGRAAKRTGPERGNGSDTASGKQTAANGVARKRKAPQEPPVAAAPAPAPAKAATNDKPEEDEMSTRRWAEGMLQAQKGHDIGASNKSKETRVKTVKQSNALHTQVLSPTSGTEADDDLSPVPSLGLGAGDVSDMLEPAPKGPSSLRVTAPTQPQKEKVARQPKQEVVETKKQRQNRKRVEERRAQREEGEQERKKLEESQRRTAREARGEPAKNGIPVSSKPPAVSAWTAGSPPSANGNANAPLLDTFDAESQSSSNGGLGEASTGPTSTTSGGPARYGDELPSEEEQMAQAMKQSEDESGWTTVAAQPKRNAKKNKAAAADLSNNNTDSTTTTTLSNKTNLPSASASASTKTSNGKPIGFQALDVQYEQRADADPNDAANWDA